MRILLVGFSPPRGCFLLKVIDMQTRFLGASELAVSAIGLGCMGMSEFYGPSDDEVSLTVLHEAQALGVRMFDSADTYGHGHNEALLGRFLRGLAASAREQVVVATKFGIVRQPGEYGRRIDNSPGYIRAACEASLQRLQGNRMNSSRTKSEELLTVFVRSRRNQPTHFDASLAWDRVKADQIQRDVLEDCKIMRRMTGAGAHLVISEGHVHAPVQAILHGPV